MKQFLKSKKALMNFVERAKAVHGEKNDYSLVRYRGASKRVTIICKKHGDFEQTPTSHLSGKGCPYCAGNRPTRDEFLDTVRLLYGDVYEYSKCTYTHKTGKSEHITVTCKVHGDFIVKVEDHLKGIGCPICLREAKKLEKQVSKQKPVREKSEELLDLDEEITYPVILRFTDSKTQVKSYHWTDGYDSKEKAESFVSILKMCMEMADHAMIESKILEKRHRYIDREHVAWLIKWLSIGSLVEYMLWWDELKPGCLPRNLFEHYSNVEEMFNNADVDMVLSFLNTIKLTDSDERMRA
jgi:hypothetical protein